MQDLLKDTRHEIKIHANISLEQSIVSFKVFKWLHQSSAMVLEQAQPIGIDVPIQISQLNANQPQRLCTIKVSGLHFN